MSTEKLILGHLLYNEEFTRKTLPYLSEDYFEEIESKALLKLVKRYIDKFNKIPTKEALIIDIENSNIKETLYEKLTSLISSISIDNQTSLEWLVDTTEKFCQDQAIKNGILKCIEILDNKGGDLDKGSIPSILQEALSVSFDNHIGHDYVDDAENRFEIYHNKEKKIPFDIEKLNQITDGGLSDKTLTIIVAASGGGKSIAMCHMAAANLSLGKNVLYITMEMSEERIAERNDANILDIPVHEVRKIEKSMFMTKINRIKNKTKGKLIIKEYPTGAAHAGHFRHLLNELKLKKKFIPDIVYIDYLNICASSRIKMGAGANSYTYIKSVAEELRGLAQEFCIPVVTAIQFGRNGQNNTNPEVDDIADSIGILYTTDLMFAIINTEELEPKNQVLVKQLKNRYSDMNRPNKFVIGIDKNKMRLYDVEDDAASVDKPVFDNSSFGDMSEDRKNKFKGLV